MKNRINSASFIIIFASHLFSFFGIVFYGEAKVVQPAVFGSFDSLEVVGSKLAAYGWAGAVNRGSEVESISLWFGETLVDTEEFEKLERPDVVKAMNRKDLLLSGWRISTVLPNDFKNNIEQINVRVKIDDGTVTRFVFHNKIRKKSSTKSHISPYATGVIVYLTQLALLFFILFSAKYFPNTKTHIESTSAEIRTDANGEKWLYRMFFFMIGVAGIKFFLMKFTETIILNLLAIISACIFSYVLVPRNRVFDINAVPSDDYKKNLLLLTIVMIYQGWLYSHGIVLPAHDPIAIPTFASILSQNIPLNKYYAEVHSSGGMYPPGFPHLLSISYIFLNNISVLFLFKCLSVCAIGLIPFTWAWLAKRVFIIPLPLITIAIAFYIAGYGIERTLNYSLPFAGKNAQLFLLAIFPLFFVFLLDISYRNWLQIVTLGFLFYCLILFHYSTLYLSVALFIAVLIVRYLAERSSIFALIKRGLFIGVVAIIGIGWFLLFSGDITHNLRDTFHTSYNLKEGFNAFVDMFFGKNSSTLAIFNSTEFQNITSPLRGYFLIICLSFSAIVSHQTRKKCEGKSARAIFLCSGSFFTAIAIGGGLGCGLIPSSLNIDFYRWFIFPVQLGVIACALLSGYILLKNINQKNAIFVSASFLILLIWIFISDTIRVKKVADMSAISSDQLQNLISMIKPGPSGCGILAPNITMSNNAFIVQKYKILEYAEMVTGCWLLSGSWLHQPKFGWHEKDALKPSDALNSIPKGMNIYFVGTDSEFNTYQNESSWEKIGHLPFARVNIYIWERNGSN